MTEGCVEKPHFANVARRDGVGGKSARNNRRTFGVGLAYRSRAHGILIVVFIIEIDVIEDAFSIACNVFAVVARTLVELSGELEVEPCRRTAMLPDECLDLPSHNFQSFIGHFMQARSFR